MFVVKVPGINGEGDTSGCRNSGNGIISELRNIKFNESGKVIDVNLFDLEEIHVDNSDKESSDMLIYKNSLDAFEEKKKTIFLGGDHSITYSLGRAFLEYCKKENKFPCMIVFDSRPDCKISKEDAPNNASWMRALIDSGFPKENLLLVGMRNYSPEEINFVKEKGIRNISMNQFVEDIHETCDFIMEFSEKKELYVSIDIGVIDPIFVPGATHKDVGGFSSRDFIYILQRINKIKNLKCLDLVEINEMEDKNKETLRLGAKIVSEII